MPKYKVTLGDNIVGGSTLITFYQSEPDFNTIYEKAQKLLDELFGPSIVGGSRSIVIVEQV